MVDSFIVLSMNNKNTIVYVDMDGVLCDIAAGYQRVLASNPEIQFPQSVPGIFESLDPIENAIESVNTLRELCDVWVLSAPSPRNPHSYSEKRIWIEKHFDYAFAKKLILATDKSLLRGDYLIDDHASGKGQESFQGELVLFGSPQYKDWDAVLRFVVGRLQ